MEDREYFPPIPPIPTTFLFKYDSKEEARLQEAEKDPGKVEKTLTQFCREQLVALSLTELADVTDSEDEDATYPPPPPNEVEENLNRLKKYYETHKTEDCYEGECNDPRKLQRLIDLDDEAWLAWSPEQQKDRIRYESSEERLPRVHHDPVEEKPPPSPSDVKANEVKSDLQRLKRFLKEKSRPDYNEMLFRRLLLVGSIPFSEVENEIKPLSDTTKDEAFKQIVKKMEDNIANLRAVDEANLQRFDSLASYFSYYDQIEQVKCGCRLTTVPKKLTGPEKRLAKWKNKWSRRQLVPMFGDYMTEVRHEEYTSRMLFLAEKPEPSEFLLTWERQRPHKNRLSASLNYLN